MARYATGKKAWGFSDRSGFRYRLREMKTEWNGLKVGPDEYEAKHPQLEPNQPGPDPTALYQPRVTSRTEVTVENLLGLNPFTSTASSAVITVLEPSHGRSTSDTVVFRNVNGSPGGLVYSLFENSSGFSITVIDTNSYSFDCGSNATVTEKSGGMFVTAGPVTLTP